MEWASEMQNGASLWNPLDCPNWIREGIKIVNRRRNMRDGG